MDFTVYLPLPHSHYWILMQISAYEIKLPGEYPHVVPGSSLLCPYRAHSDTRLHTNVTTRQPPALQHSWWHQLRVFLWSDTWAFSTGKWQMLHSESQGLKGWPLTRTRRDWSVSSVHTKKDQEASKKRSLQLKSWQCLRFSTTDVNSIWVLTITLSQHKLHNKE